MAKRIKHPKPKRRDPRSWNEIQYHAGGPRMITIKIRRHHLVPGLWRIESIDQAGADYPTRLQTHDIIDGAMARRLFASDRFRVLLVSSVADRVTGWDRVEV